MKEIVIISGKGGTGKTVIAGAFAALAKDKVLADCDVDAADLHLLLDPKVEESHIFKSGLTAFTHKKYCEGCGVCSMVCRFEAVRKDFSIDPVSCEGCAFCSLVCPKNAIEMKSNTSGEWFISQTRFGPMVHAKLGIAEENSGKLVSLVRKKAREIAGDRKYDLIIIDGSPGIGCPVIASITGAYCAVVVIEPTLSGLHDAERVVDVARHFDIQVKVIINKYDLNCNITKKIEEWAKNRDIEILGEVVFSKTVVESVVEGKTIMEYSKNKVAGTLSKIWKKLEIELEGQVY
jgi:MinD superfamily P-loop ATPase